MSKELSAYEKMLNNGTAFKEVDMTQSMEPSLADIQETSNGLGERNMEEKLKEEIKQHNDYRDFDSVMEQRVANLRNKIKNPMTNKIGKIVTPTQKEIIALKERIKKLEEIVMIIMQTQEQLLE